MPQVLTYSPFLIKKKNSCHIPSPSSLSVQEGDLYLAEVAVNRATDPVQKTTRKTVICEACDVF